MGQRKAKKKAGLHNESQLVEALQGMKEADLLHTVIIPLFNGRLMNTTALMSLEKT